MLPTFAQYDLFALFLISCTSKIYENLVTKKVRKKWTALRCEYLQKRAKVSDICKRKTTNLLIARNQNRETTKILNKTQTP